MIKLSLSSNKENGEANEESHIYEIEEKNLLKYPDTMLGRMFTSGMAKPNEKDGTYNITWDFEESCFVSLLDYFRKGNFELPENTNCSIVEMKHACNYMLVPFNSEVVNNVEKFCFYGDDAEIQFRYDLLTHFRMSGNFEYLLTEDEYGCWLESEFGFLNKSESLASFAGTGQDSKKWNIMRMLYFEHGLYVQCRDNLRFRVKRIDRNNPRHTDWYAFRNRLASETESR